MGPRGTKWDQEGPKWSQWDQDGPDGSTKLVHMYVLLGTDCLVAQRVHDIQS